jgi:hypothetical protein
MKLSSIALVASLAYASAVAQAAIVSYSDSFPATDVVFKVPFGTTLSLPKFQSTFGTLNGATLTLSFDLLAQIEVINSDSAGSSFTSASAAFPITVKSNGVDATSFAAKAIYESLSGNVSPGVGSKFSQGGAAHGFSSQDVRLSGLPSYIGSGVDDITFELTASVGEYKGEGPTSLLFSGSGKEANGTLSVSYDYTPKSPIPEPSTAVLMGLGMLAIGVSLRRRRRED